MDDKQARRQRFGAALERALGGRSRSWLGAEVAEAENRETAISQSAVSQWINGETAPDPDRVFIIERVLGLVPGSLSRHLGFVPVDARPPTIREAIGADDTLANESDARFLGEMYDRLPKKPAAGARTGRVPSRR